MKTSILILLIPLLFFGITESFADQIKVKLGETVSYDDLKIYFYDVEDSRCPSDVTCVWEGKVSAMIRYINATHKIGGPHELNLPVEYGGHSFVLRDVSPHPISTEKPDYVVTLQINKSKPGGEFVDEQVCDVGNILVKETCQPSKPPPSDFRDLQRGETIPNPEMAIIIQSLGAILVVFFIALYAIKKRMVKKNEN